MTTRLLDRLNRKGKSLAVRLVRLTGKSPHRIHPKHLVEQPWNEWYLEHLGPEDIVLDFGCGPGAHALRAARRCREVIGLDRDDGIVITARARAFAAGVSNAHFFSTKDLAVGPLPSGTFDRVLMLDVIEHLDDRPSALQEVRRLLKPKGLLLLSAPNAGTTWRGQLRRAGLFAYSDPDHRVEYTEASLREELGRAGFEPLGLSLTPTVYDTPWAGLIDCVGGLSLGLYRRLQAWKRRKALEHPEETTGFCVVARPT